MDSDATGTSGAASAYRSRSASAASRSAKDSSTCECLRSRGILRRAGAAPRLVRKNQTPSPRASPAVHQGARAPENENAAPGPSDSSSSSSSSPPPNLLSSSTRESTRSRSSSRRARRSRRSARYRSRGEPGSGGDAAPAPPNGSAERRRYPSGDAGAPPSAASGSVGVGAAACSRRAIAACSLIMDWIKLTALSGMTTLGGVKSNTGGRGGGIFKKKFLVGVWSRRGKSQRSRSSSARGSRTSRGIGGRGGEGRGRGALFREDDDRALAVRVRGDVVPPQGVADVSSALVVPDAPVEALVVEPDEPVPRLLRVRGDVRAHRPRDGEGARAAARRERAQAALELVHPRRGGRAASARLPRGGGGRTDLGEVAGSRHGRRRGTRARPHARARVSEWRGARRRRVSSWSAPPFSLLDVPSLSSNSKPTPSSYLKSGRVHQTHNLQFEFRRGFQNPSVPFKTPPLAGGLHTDARASHAPPPSR